MKPNAAQILQQFQTIWKQLGINQRVSLVLAGLVVIGGMASLMVWSSRADYALLYGRLDDAEAAKVIAALDETKIAYRVNRGGGAVSVPADKVHLVRMQLAAKGIPRGEGVGFEIFDKPNFGLSDFVQRANYLRAVQGELARTIGQVDSIESARVMIVIPENRLLVDEQRKPTASVFVRVRGNSTLGAQTAQAIRFLVANAVEGLTASNVSIVDNLGNVLSDSMDSNSPAGLSSNQLTAQKNFEQYLARKAEGMLDRVLGPGQSVVRVAAEINFDSLTTTEEKYDPESQVIRSATITDENVESTNPGGGGGTPGVVTDSGTETNLTTLAGNNSSNRTRRKVTNNQYEINRIVSNMIQNAGGIKRLSAAVFVAAQVTVQGTNRVVTPRTPEELQKLRRIVQSALGIQESDPLRQDGITVEEMPFNEQPVAEVSRQLDTDRRQLFWWGLAKNVSYPLVSLGVLALFWRTFRRTPVNEIPIGIPLTDFTPAGGGNGHRLGTPVAAGKGKSIPGAITPETLNQLIREKPADVSQALRLWMAKGNS
ncbi:MAG: flagellar basal-body MS-ring/collar protein FliF [Verrucomicrobiia bacterium]